MTYIMSWLLVFIGGGLGSLGRWMLFKNINHFFPALPTFWITLVVNAAGCLLMGYLFSWWQTKSSETSFQLFWLIGFLGGFTTFSTLGLDIFQLVGQHSILYASGYFILHGLFCILMIYMGHWIFSLL
jgi:fluoride exporter